MAILAMYQHGRDARATSRVRAGPAALEKERKQNNPVLFPIRLDDAVTKTRQAWASNLRRTRHIGGFRAGKDHDP